MHLHCRKLSQKRQTTQTKFHSSSSDPLIWIFATTTKICTRTFSSPSLRNKPSVKVPYLSYSTNTTREKNVLKVSFSFSLSVEYRKKKFHKPLAPSIFRADSFGRWVVTHSLNDSYFHGHIPAVIMNQHLFWYLELELKIWLPNSTFGSSHIASSAYQKWPTKHIYYSFFQ